VINSKGTVKKIFRGHGINGPWDATVMSQGRSAALFVANVLNGTVAAKGKVVHRGTVLRLNISFGRGKLPAIRKVTKVGSGFAQRTDPAAFVLGPTGLGLGRNGVLYVADTEMSRITAISHALSRRSSAGTGKVLTSGGKLNAPLGLAIAPNGDVLTVNGGDGRIVETTPSGMQIASRFLNRSGSPPGSGALFGLAVKPGMSGVYFVNDAANTLRLLH
jgi:DNA-binding beta-propeller fold protein YncE